MPAHPTLHERFPGAHFYSNRDTYLITVGEGTTIEPRARIHWGVQIGTNCWIGADSHIHSNASIGNNSVIGSGCYIGSCVTIPAGSVVQPGTQVNSIHDLSEIVPVTVYTDYRRLALLVDEGITWATTAQRGYFEDVQACFFSMAEGEVNVEFPVPITTYCNPNTSFHRELVQELYEGVIRPPYAPGLSALAAVLQNMLAMGKKEARQKRQPRALPPIKGLARLTKFALEIEQ